MALTPDQYAWMSAREIIAGVSAKTFKAEEVTQAAIARAKALNPKLNVFNSINEELALKHAKAVDDKVASGKNPGRLAGVPVALKDNLCVKGTKTTCSSKILADYVPPYTATAVERLLAEGGIPFGKCNLDEFAMGSSTENSAFGSTKNPWNVECVPGGSSGGSAVAVAAGITPLALAPILAAQFVSLRRL